MSARPLHEVLNDIQKIIDAERAKAKQYEEDYCARTAKYYTLVHAVRHLLSVEYAKADWETRAPFIRELRQLVGGDSIPIAGKGTLQVPCETCGKKVMTGWFADAAPKEVKCTKCSAPTRVEMKPAAKKEEE